MQSDIDISKFSGAALQVLDASQLLVFAARAFTSNRHHFVQEVPASVTRGSMRIICSEIDWGINALARLARACDTPTRMNHLCRSAARGPGCTRK